MQTRDSVDAPFQIRFTLPLLTKWALEGYTERDEAKRRIDALLTDGWTVESRGVQAADSLKWVREGVKGD